MTSPFRDFAAQICFGPDAVKRLQRGQCPDCGCNEAAATIRDEKSRREFHITGLCQNCQDGVFNDSK